MRYHNITTDDMLNGDGLRTVLWVAGCSHHCKGCQNPQTWDINGGIPFDTAALEEICTELKKSYISGLTLSGGDPLNINNINYITMLCEYIKKKFPKKTIWIYTGYTWEVLKQAAFYKGILKKAIFYKSILKYADVIVDGEYIEELRDITLPWRGSSNQRVIDVQRSLKEGRVVLWCQ